MNKIRILTLGCRLNQIESESTAKLFLDENFSVNMDMVTAQSEEDSETVLCILNTCTVTQKAEQKARRIIRLLLKKYSEAAILVTGCYAQLSPEEICKIDSRICIIGGQIKSRVALVPQLLRKEIQNNTFSSVKFASIIKNRITDIPSEKKDYPENSFKLATSSFLAHSRASLKIQDGCNNNCAYCAIHIARGHSVSIPVEIAILRVQELENNNQDEVVLTTVNIGQYRSSYKGEEINFAKLLKILLESTKKINFRISSLYPEVVDEEFCKVISNSRVRPHFHISVQSGSDKILKLMNRRYVSDDVVQACKKIRAVKENPFIACDIITGFPGETDEDFNLTVNLAKNCDFSWIHAFPYSERPGTPAATMADKVPQSVSGERAKILTDWAISSKIEYVEKFVGKELPAILETVKRNPSVLSTNKITYHAVTENFIHCEIVTDKVLDVNKTVYVKINKAAKERILKGGEIEAIAEIV